MKSPLFLSILLIFILAGGGMYVLNTKEGATPENMTMDHSSVSSSGVMVESKSSIAVPAAGQPVKEFVMNSFVEFVDGKPKPQFAPNTLTVKKGDFVRIKITVTKGMHDFKLDEFGIYAATPLNQETLVEFTADKAGTFIYYCNQPGHRELGHWGTLTVVE